MAHLWLALHSTTHRKIPHRGCLMQAFGLIIQARRQVWQAQSKLPEACHNNFLSATTDKILVQQLKKLFRAEFLQWSLVPSTLSAVYFGPSTHGMPVRHTTPTQAGTVLQACTAGCSTWFCLKKGGILCSL